MTALALYAHLRSRLQLALAINAVVIAAEFVGGWVLNSIGLMSDASHNLVDQGSLSSPSMLISLRRVQLRRLEPSATIAPESLPRF